MQEEKFGELIKNIRKKYNLTQKDLADKYHVTYQAVSKWENGKNMPDVTILKEISKDFNLSLEDLMEGNLIEKKSNKSQKNKIIIFTLISCILLIAIIIFIIKNVNSDFESRTLSTTCDNFKISGIISYNEKKSLIFIPKIEYCGESKNIYKEITCTLYEKDKDVIKKISDFTYNENEITLEDFLSKVTFNVDNYLKVCNIYSKDSFYLEIKATDKENKVTSYNVPITLDDKCLN